MESLSEITINNSGGRGGRREPGRTGAGEGGKRENEGQAAGSIWGREAGSIWGREAGSIWGREAGAEIKKAIVCFSLLGIIQSKTPI